MGHLGLNPVSYGGVVGVLNIGRHQFLIKMICCLEVSVQACAGVGKGVFSQKLYRVKYV